MNEPGPEQTILEELARPAGQWESGSQRSSSGWQSGIVRGGNAFQADISTVRLVKHRESGTGRRRLYFVTFNGSIPPRHDQVHALSWLYPLQQNPDGHWQVIGGAGGGSDDDEPSRGAPWANLAGGGWPDQFYAGGTVDPAGHDIAHVQLRFADGLTLQDDTDHGIVLFITDDAVRIPATVVLLDRAGNAIATDPGFPYS